MIISPLKKVDVRAMSDFTVSEKTTKKKNDVHPLL